MSESSDPRCPECGGPIGETAVYCMHCSADLTDEREAHDADDDGVWDSAEPSTASGTEAGQPGESVGADSSDSASTSVARPAEEVAAAGSTAEPATGESASDRLLDPDGIVDNTLTVVVGIVGGIVVGLMSTFELLLLTGSGWALPLGFVAWLGATSYLVRRRTVQGAVSASAYAVAAVLLIVPLIALSPVADVEGGLEARGGLLVVLFFFVGAPALVAVGVGWAAGRFVPDDASESGN